MAIKIIKASKKIQKDNLPLVIGYFGCVHVMHQQLLTKYNDYNILTFTDLMSKRPHQVYNYKLRLENLKKFNPKNIYVLNVSAINMTGDMFVKRILNKINPSSILVGDDFKYGSVNCTVRDLKHHFKVETLNYNSDISTKKIFSLLSSGKIEEANDLSSFNFYIIGRWISGSRWGRKIGWPTINVADNNHNLLPEGSYVSLTTLGNKQYKSITFVGASKTIKHTKPVVETHIINKRIINKTLYPFWIRNNVKVEFLKFIRPNTKFNSIDELKDMIAKDKVAATKFFKEQGF